MFEIEAIENGGTFTSPTRHGGWLNSHLTEINMHGIFTTGETDDEAIIHWINQARALVKMSA